MVEHLQGDEMRVSLQRTFQTGKVLHLGGLHLGVKDFVDGADEEVMV
jgi:hypothetical protein